jgi:hypothetical protein
VSKDRSSPRKTRHRERSEAIHLPQAIVETWIASPALRVRNDDLPVFRGVRSAQTGARIKKGAKGAAPLWKPQEVKGQSIKV